MTMKTGEDRYHYYMGLTERDPMAAGNEFLAELRSAKRPNAKLIRALERILAGDEEAWHHQAKNFQEAVALFISNTIFSAWGIGVVKPSGVREDIVDIVANLVTEDVDFLPWTVQQRRLKLLAESYGFAVYRLQ